MHERTTAQAVLAHEQSEKVENKLSELTKKLDKDTHVMEEQQFNFAYSNKARELRVDSNTQNLERVDGRETETEKVDQTREIQNVTNTSVSYDNLENSISGKDYNNILEFKWSTDRDEGFQEVKDAEAHEQHKSIIGALKAAAPEWEFEQINFVVGNRGSVVESDFYTKLKKLAYKKEKKTSSSPIM